jgi:hypothetical protein
VGGRSIHHERFAELAEVVLPCECASPIITVSSGLHSYDILVCIVSKYCRDAVGDTRAGRGTDILEQRDAWLTYK